MTLSRRGAPLVLAAAAFAACGAASTAAAAEPCCFNNFRFAGGCMEVPSGDETCASILAYLNSFDSVGRGYCSNTTVRGGWSLVPCASAMDNQPQIYTPGRVDRSEDVRQQRPTVQPGQPQTAPEASDAKLLEVSAPLAVRFDEGLDAGSLAAGQVITGTLEQDLLDGETVVAPAGARVTAQVVPTSLWGNAEGDAFQLQATGIQIGESMVQLTGDADGVDDGGAVAAVNAALPDGSVLQFTSAPVEALPGLPDGLRAFSAGNGARMRAFNAHDADSLAALYAEDAVMLPPNQVAVFGREAIRARFSDLFESSDLKVEIEALETVIEDSLAYVAGRYRMWTGDGELVDRGKYVEIWRARNGQWLIHRDIHNSSLPTPASDE